MSGKGKIITELLKEKSLWDIYVSSRKIPNSEFNICITIISLIAFLFLSFDLSKGQLIELVEYFSSIGLQTSIGIVGFLVAGFTIFATISKPDMFIEMAEHINEKSQLSVLKHNFFILYRVFIYYIIYIFFCLFVLVLTKYMSFDCLGYVAGKKIYSCEETAYWLSLTFALQVTGLVFVTLQLKSFVFNIYHAVMTSLSWQVVSKSDEPDRERRFRRRKIK